jgi:hypothetical protein
LARRWTWMRYDNRFLPILPSLLQLGWQFITGFVKHFVLSYILAQLAAWEEITPSLHKKLFTYFSFGSNAIIHNLSCTFRLYWRVSGAKQKLGAAVNTTCHRFLRIAVRNILSSTRRYCNCKPKFHPELGCIYAFLVYVVLCTYRPCDGPLLRKETVSAR